MLFLGKIKQPFLFILLVLQLCLTTSGLALAEDLYIFGGGGGGNTASASINGGSNGGGNGVLNVSGSGGGAGGIYIGPTDTINPATKGQDGVLGGAAAGLNCIENNCDIGTYGTYGSSVRYTITIPANKNPTGTYGGNADGLTITFNDQTTIENVFIKAGQSNSTNTTRGIGSAIALEGTLKANNISINDSVRITNNVYTSRIVTTTGLNVIMSGDNGVLNINHGNEFGNLGTTRIFKSLDVGDTNVVVNDFNSFNWSDYVALYVETLIFGKGSISVNILNSFYSTQTYNERIILTDFGAKISTNVDTMYQDSQFKLSYIDVYLPDEYKTIPMLTLDGGLINMSDTFRLHFTVNQNLTLNKGDIIRVVKGGICIDGNCYNAQNIDTVGPSLSVKGVTNYNFITKIITTDLNYGILDTDGIYLEYLGVAYSDAAYIYSESYMAGLLNINDASNLVQNVIDDLPYSCKTNLTHNETSNDGNSCDGFIPFAKAKYSEMRYATGGILQTQTYSLILGVTKAWNMNKGKFRLGGFVEGSKGSYNINDSFFDSGVNIIGKVHANGDIDYFGGGLLSRYDSDFGLYVDGSVRFGKNKFEFETSNLYDDRTSYNTNSGYFGAHLGFGYKIDAFEQDDALEIYAKLIINKLFEDETMNSAGEILSFDTATSVKTKVGVRIAHQLDDYVWFYSGLAIDQEFDSILTSHINGEKIQNVNLKGSNVTGELGLKLNPLSKGHFSADLGLFYIGGLRAKSKGGGGLLTLNYQL
jgi:hypothetical protein